MNEWLTDFLAEYVPLAASSLGVQWPPNDDEVTVMTTVQGVQHNLVEMLLGRAGKGWKFVLPGFFIDIGKFTESPQELGMSVQSLMRAPMTTVLIQDLGEEGTQNTANSAMFNLKKVIEARPSTFNTFTRIEQGQLVSNLDCPINMDLLANSEVDVICSGLIYNPGLLVQLY